jgi:glycosyltransferase involved in cell wall biosynthesis
MQTPPTAATTSSAPNEPYLSLILPAYNEAKRIAQTVGEAVGYFQSRQFAYEIIVAADGDDGTREIVAAMGKANPAIKVMGSAARGGKGLGIRRAVGVATGRFIGFSDADNKTPIEEFDKFEPFLRAGVDVVIGSRARGKALIEKRQPLHRRLGSKAFAVIMQALVGLRGISDSQCGFKFFQAPVARHLFERQRIDGYMFDVEILFLSLKARYRIEQVPVRWRDDADSRFNLISGSIRDMHELLSIRLAASRGHYDQPRRAHPPGVRIENSALACTNAIDDLPRPR